MDRGPWFWVGIGCLLIFLVCCCLSTMSAIVYNIWG
jgi:hypothetical protein